MGLKPLGVVKEIVEAAGIGISYAFDDLVFIDHNAFLLQFGDRDDEVLIHLNREADLPSVKDILARLEAEASARNMIFRSGKFYALSREDEDNIRLEFMDMKK